MRQFEIDVKIANLKELKALEKIAGADGFSTISLADSFIEPAFCTKPVPATMSDAEAAHHLSWRASDLSRLKFNVIEHRLVWRD